MNIIIKTNKLFVLLFSIIMLLLFNACDISSDDTEYIYEEAPEYEGLWRTEYEGTSSDIEIAITLLIEDGIFEYIYTAFDYSTGSVDFGMHIIGDITFESDQIVTDPEIINYGMNFNDWYEIDLFIEDRILGDVNRGVTQTEAEERWSGLGEFVFNFEAGDMTLTDASSNIFQKIN